MLGLDRIPEVKTLREKIGLLSNNDKPSQWASALSSEWMESDPDNAAILYIDGHVRAPDRCIRGWKTDNKRFPVHRFTKMGLLSFEREFLKKCAGT